MIKNKNITGLLIFVVVIIVINILAAKFFTRLDLTEDKRYSLSSAAKEIVDDVESPVIIDVFLEGSFPSEFRRLKEETRQMLEEFAAYNSNIKFNFIDPLAEGDDANAIAEEFYKLGMTPARLNVLENGKNSETIIFPWAIANFEDKTVKIPLLKNQIGASDEERVSSSVQQLEYVFTDGLNKLIYPRAKKIAVMRGNGELPDARIADFIKAIQEYYFLAPFTLDSVANNPQKTLEDLKSYDLLIEAKPIVPYSEKEKYVLDQYLMSGGKLLWMAEMTNMENDSLFNERSAALALPRDLNLGDYFFSYGLRINSELVNDLYSAPIILASGSGNETRFNPYPWYYSPLTSSMSTHPIVNNIEAVKFNYANPIDLLKNDLQKTVLLSSSPKTKLEGTPLQIGLDIIGSKPQMESYTAGEQPLAVLLEGSFKSVYSNRVKPFETTHLDNSLNTKMVVISDGDVVKNDLQQGKPLELGFERYTGMTYGNKEFLLNTVNYLLDDSGLVDIRTKEISLAFLNRDKVAAEREMWQMVTIIVPLIILALFGLAFNYFRKRSYIR